MANYQESNQSSGTLPFYNTQVENLLNMGNQVLGNQNWMWGQAPQQQVAGFSGLQNQAFGMVPGMMGAWKPTVQGGLTALESAQQAAQFNPNQLQQFMNPYTQNVVNEIARVGNENLQRNVLPSVRNQYGGLGQYGSARQALATGTAAAQAQKDILGQQANAMNTNFNQAMQNYGNFAQLGAQTGLQAGQQYGNLAGTQSQLGIADYGTMFSAGQAQQGLQQQQLNAQYQNQQAQQQRPWDLLNQWSNLFKVSTPQSSSSSSWSTQLKEGGLVRYAKGGMTGHPPDWDPLVIDEEKQTDRDRIRKLMLLRELDQYPDDAALKKEISYLPELSPLSPSTQVAQLASTLSDISSPSIGVDTSRPDILKGLIGQRSDFNRRVQESLAPLPEPSGLEKINRALYEADALGPGNYGQIIGRVGNQYFEQEDYRQKVNQAREQAQLALEEKGLPKLTGTSLTGGVEHFKNVRGKDGSLWAVSDVDPSRRTLVQPGTYAPEILKAATAAADKDMEGAFFKDSSQRAEARRGLIDHYAQILSNKFSEFDPTEKEKPVIPPAPRMPAESPEPGISGARPEPGSIPSSQETKEQEKVGTQMGAEFAELQKEARETQSTLNNHERLGQLLQDVSTGKLTPAGTELSGWIKSVGEIPALFGYKKRFQDWENLSNKEAAQALIGEMALQMRNPSGGAGMPGAMSDKDREFLITMTPSLSTTPGGIKLMIETQRKLAKRAQDVAKLAREYRAQNPRKTFDEGFYDYLQKWSNEHPLFEAPAKKSRTLDELLNQYGKE